MNQYNIVLIGAERVLEKARAYAQKFMPFEFGNPKGWVFSKEDIPYVGECQVLKILSEEIAELAAKTLRGIEGLLVLNPAVSALEN